VGSSIHFQHAKPTIKQEKLRGRKPVHPEQPFLKKKHTKGENEENVLSCEMKYCTP